MPFFSVVMPVYNREKYVAKAVDSVLSQSYQDFELIIIDDGSTDSTGDVIRSYSDERIKYLRQNNAGPSSARNNGIKNSGGKYIAFLDSDDWWLKDKLKKVREAVEENPDTKIFHTLERWFRGGKHLNQKKRHRPPSGYFFSRALELCCVSLSTAVVKKDIFDEHGLFDETYPACEDYEFWLRVSPREKIYLVEDVLTEKEGGHPGQQSRKYPAMDIFRIRAIRKLLDRGKLSEDERRIAVEELRKKCRIYSSGARKRGRIKEADEYADLYKNYI